MLTLQRLLGHSPSSQEVAITLDRYSHALPTLQARDGHHHGPPAIPSVEVRLVGGTAEGLDAMESGAMQWFRPC